MILFIRRKMKDDISQEIHGNMIFSVRSVKFILLPFVIKTLFNIKDDKNDYFYKNVPLILCTSTETFISVFIYFFPVRKKHET